ncbi:MAG: hypothetical protein E6K22_03395, partial [Gammaproteobacteria bacterium]
MALDSCQRTERQSAAGLPAVQPESLIPCHWGNPAHPDAPLAPRFFSRGSSAVKPLNASITSGHAGTPGTLLTLLLLGLTLSGCGSDSSPSAQSPVTPVAPAITTQPASQTVSAGQTATFTVAATGTAPLSYQWQKNGTAIGGATAASYTTPATTASDNGDQFTVVVSNAAGSVTSRAAALTVNAALVAPTITTQPASQTVSTGQTATFTVTATGT